MDNSKTSFKIPAIKISQLNKDDKSIYFAKIKVEDFVNWRDYFKIDYYKRISMVRDEGYQRQAIPSAVNKIKDFVIQESNYNPIIPTAIVANAREVLDFNQQNNFGYGLLKINTTLHIIDGQHRYEAWKSMMQVPEYKEKLHSFEFPIIILSGFGENKEIEQFYVINSRQRKIKTDLAQRHLLRLKSDPETSSVVPDNKKWELHAVKIVDILNEQMDDIWKDRIGLPNDVGDIKKSRIISQSSFVSSLKPFFVGKNKLFDFPNVRLEDAANFLAQFWDMVSKAYILPTKYPHKYSLMKTVGVFSLHIFLAEIARDYYDLSKDEGEILKKARARLIEASKVEFQDSFWSVDVPESQKKAGRSAASFSSAAGHSRLAAALYGFSG